VIQRLLEIDVNFSLKDYYGSTPLELANLGSFKGSRLSKHSRNKWLGKGFYLVDDKG
jgi:hypothetical protein